MATTRQPRHHLHGLALGATSPQAPYVDKYPQAWILRIALMSINLVHVPMILHEIVGPILGAALNGESPLHVAERTAQMPRAVLCRQLSNTTRLSESATIKRSTQGGFRPRWQSSVAKRARSMPSDH